jgi:hypothetical protein
LILINLIKKAPTWLLTPSSPNLFVLSYEERIRALIFGLWGGSDLTILDTVDPIHTWHIRAAYLVIGANVGRSGTKIVDAYLACGGIDGTVEIILGSALTVLCYMG